VTAKLAKLLTLAAVIALSISCGDFVRQGRSPVQLVVDSLSVAKGLTLLSDVANTSDPCSIASPCIFNDIAKATLHTQLKDQGGLVTATPSPVNTVTIDRYHVEYRRSDNRNTPGVDVPYPFDSALTMTVAQEGSEASFQIVRHSAKQEAPLKALFQNREVISPIATVTFYGHDQAGNDVSVAAMMGVDFGDFADETN